MSDKITLQDVINHMSVGFGRLETRFDGLEKRLDGLERRMTLVERKIDDLAEQITAMREDFHASMQDIGHIKKEQVTQNRRITVLEETVGASAA